MKVIDIHHSIPTSMHQLRKEKRGKIMTFHNFTFSKNLELNVNTILANNSFSTVAFVILISGKTFRVKVTKYHAKAQKLIHNFSN